MKLVFYSVVLNHHQAPVADAFYKLLGNDYIFVETTTLGDTKGATENYSKRPYLLQAWGGETHKQRAMELARTADVCIFGGNEALPYMQERMKMNLLSFQIGERWLKRGWSNLLSPRLLKFLKVYHLGRWCRKPLYKLCASAFAAEDDNKLGIFKNRCYKWGYFTKLEENRVTIRIPQVNEPIRLMWCARFLVLKHPELPIHLAQRLKALGYNFILDMYGDGIVKEQSIRLVQNLSVADVVKFHGNVSNEQVRKAMREHDIFLFTSDKNEGWGAVLNEAMNCACVPVASDAIGSVPYLIKDGENGLIFESCNLDALVEKIVYLFDHPAERCKMAKYAQQTIETLWSPEHAVFNLIQLIADLQTQQDSSLMCGPCSKA